MTLATFSRRPALLSARLTLLMAGLATPVVAAQAPPAKEELSADGKVVEQQIQEYYPDFKLLRREAFGGNEKLQNDYEKRVQDASQMMTLNAALDPEIVDILKQDDAKRYHQELTKYATDNGLPIKHGGQPQK